MDITEESTQHSSTGHRKSMSGSVALVASSIGEHHSGRASIIHVLPQQHAMLENPPSLMESSYPKLFQFLMRRQDWEAPFQLIEIAMGIFNDKRIFTISPEKSALEDLKQKYRNWWMISRNNPQIQDANVRKLGKLVKEFLVTALAEDPSHSIRLSLFTPDKPQQPLILESRLEHRDKEIPTQSQEPSTHLQSTDKSSTTVGTDDQKLKSHDTSKLVEFMEPSTTAAPSQGSIHVIKHHRFQTITASETSAEVLQPLAKVDDEVYMQLIMKDILNDISAKEIAAQKTQLVTISDKMGWEDEKGGHFPRSSGTVGTHGRISVFGGRRASVSSKAGALGSRSPSARQSRIVLAPRESTTTALKFPRVSSKMTTDIAHSGLTGKIEGLKIKMDKPILKDESAPSRERGKSFKDKVNVKLRLHTQVQNFVRPLGKK